MNDQRCFRSISAILLSVTVTPYCLAAALPRVIFLKKKDRIDILIDERRITSYVIDPTLPKPALVPLCSPSGISLSRRYPLTELKGGSMDHTHHLGLFFAVDRVNGTNFWNYYRNPDGREPKIKHIKILEITPGPGRGVLAALAHWIDKHGTFLLEEKKTMVFIAGEKKDEIALDITIDLTAQNEKVVFEDIEEGLLGLRLSDYLRESKQSPSLRSGAPLPRESVSGTGRYFSSNGDEAAKQIWGKRARWVALQGIRQDKVIGVAVLNHPASLNYPTYWHVRDYGLFSANPLGQGDFQRQWPKPFRKNKPIPLHFTLPPGQTVHFRFRLILYEGIRTPDQIEQRFRTFAR